MAVWGAGTPNIFGGEATAGGSLIPTLPYPAQLPQDYYAKSIAALPAPTPTSAPTPTPGPAPTTSTSASTSTTAAPPAPPPGTNQNFGGTHYGSVPPSNPLYGWIWSNTQGQFFVYQDPGVWVQVGTGF